MEVLPAVIAVDQEQLEEMLSKVKYFVAHVMLDFMDGVFVPGRSMEFDIKLPVGLDYQAHLMVEEPMRYLGRLPAEVDTAIIHVESVNYVSDVLSLAHDRGLRAFLAVNPETPVEAVAPYIPLLDGVLIMAVEPGRYGSPFLPRCLGKVEALKAIDPELVLEVDGGMNPETATLAVEMGADAVAVGSYIFGSGDPAKAYTCIMEAVQAASPRGRT
jgi:ribulose-phosphate 3-epimerase